MPGIVRTQQLFRVPRILSKYQDCCAIFDIPDVRSLISRESGVTSSSMLLVSVMLVRNQWYFGVGIVAEFLQPCKCHFERGSTCKRKNIGIATSFYIGGVIPASAGNSSFELHGVMKW